MSHYYHHNGNATGTTWATVVNYSQLVFINCKMVTITVSFTMAMGRIYYILLNFAQNRPIYNRNDRHLLHWSHHA